MGGTKRPGQAPALPCAVGRGQRPRYAASLPIFDWRCPQGRLAAKLVLISIAVVVSGLRFCRLRCGKAAPLRRVPLQPTPSRRLEGAAFAPARREDQRVSLAGKPEAFRTAGRQSRLNGRIFRQLGLPWLCRGRFYITLFNNKQPLVLRYRAERSPQDRCIH